MLARPYALPTIPRALPAAFNTVLPAVEAALVPAVTPAEEVPAEIEPGADAGSTSGANCATDSPARLAAALAILVKAEAPGAAAFAVFYHIFNRGVVLYCSLFIALGNIFARAASASGVKSSPCVVEYDTFPAS